MGFIWWMIKGALYFFILFFLGALLFQPEDHRWLFLWAVVCGAFYSMVYSMSYLEYGNWFSVRKLYRIIKDIKKGY